MDEIVVKEDKYWGAQTQRNYEDFKIGNEKTPLGVICAFAHLELTCTKANHKLSRVEECKLDAIATACDEVLHGKLDIHSPLSVWQTGSGTQSNMSVNEVIANRGNEVVREQLLYPNGDVNKGQSSNDTFPTAMHIVATEALHKQLMSQLEEIIHILRRLERESRHIIEIGRTHLRDAMPLCFSQEVSEWRGMLENNVDILQKVVNSLHKLAIRGTAVGTGLNAPQGFGDLVYERLSGQLATQSINDPNKFCALSAKDGTYFAHGVLKALAANCVKIADDVRWLTSGPCRDLQEIRISENEPGSGIMLGKVDPTQCGAMTTVAVQVMGNDAAIGFAASQGDFELNVFVPATIYNSLQSVTLLSGGLRNFHVHCVEGIRVDEEKMVEYLQHSLTLIAVLNPHIGYENAAEMAKKAYQDGVPLKEACVAPGSLSAEEFDVYVIVENMV